jgi:hypothetical protein
MTSLVTYSMGRFVDWYRAQSKIGEYNAYVVFANLLTAMTVFCESNPGFHFFRYTFLQYKLHCFLFD